jgi:DNA (cytosine-5)-methyltransferase 1
MLAGVASRAKLTVIEGSVTAVAHPVAEFFAGIGLVRMGLAAAGFDVIWSNDHGPEKHKMYAAHFGDDPAEHTFAVGDIGDVTGADLPDGLSLAWSSFPCTDLSLAGDREGIERGESKTFWDFTRILREMGQAAPDVIALENVTGLATSHGGNDMRAALRELNGLGYSVDVITLDAWRFVPQSRARVFLIGAKRPPVERDGSVSELRPQWLQFVHRDHDLDTHAARLPAPPPFLAKGLSKIIEQMPDDDARWWDDERTAKALDSLSEIQSARIELLKQRRTPDVPDRIPAHPETAWRSGSSARTTSPAACAPHGADPASKRSCARAATRPRSGG